MHLLSPGLRGAIKFIASHSEAISGRENPEGLVECYFAGKHRTVLEIKGYPYYIFKLQHRGPCEKFEDMATTIQKCRELVSTRQLHRCFVPDVRLVNFSGKAIFIEEKLEGTYDYSSARDKSEALFRKFRQDPNLQGKWIEAFTQAAEFIAITGYSDVDWRNILLMDEGLGFIDFEGVELDEVYQNKVALGLYRLLEIAPIEAIDPIIDIVKRLNLEADLLTYARLDKYGFTKETTFKEAVVMLKTKRQKEMELHASIFQHYQDKGVDPTKELATSYLESSLEFHILKLCNEHLVNYSGGSIKSPIDIRHLCLDAFEMGKLYHSFGDKVTQDMLKNALANLKSDGYIAVYLSEGNSFEIYF